MPVYYRYRIHIDCPECAHPLVVNGPFLEVKCASCGSAVSLKRDFWKSRFTMDEDGGVFIRGERLGPEPGKRKKPVCEKCEEKLPADTVEDGTEGVVFCSSCGTAHTTYPVPDWVHGIAKKNLDPIQVFCADLSSMEDDSPSNDSSPIAFSCVNCSAALELNADTPRIMECDFCNTRQFLPGALWHALHPVRKIRAWYIRYK